MLLCSACKVLPVHDICDVRGMLIIIIVFSSVQHRIIFGRLKTNKPSRIFEQLCVVIESRHTC